MSKFTEANINQPGCKEEEETLPCSFTESYATPDRIYCNIDQGRPESYFNHTTIHPCVLDEKEKYSTPDNQPLQHFSYIDHVYDEKETNEINLNFFPCDIEKSFGVNDNFDSTENNVNSDFVTEGSFPQELPAGNFLDDKTGTFWISDIFQEFVMANNNDLDMQFADAHDEVTYISNFNGENVKGEEQFGQSSPHWISCNPESADNLACSMAVCDDAKNRRHTESNQVSENKANTWSPEYSQYYDLRELNTACDVPAYPRFSHINTSVENESYIKSNIECVGMNSFQSSRPTENFLYQSYEDNRIQSSPECLASGKQLSIAHDPLALSELSQLIPDFEQSSHQDLSSNSSADLQPENNFLKEVTSSLDEYSKVGCESEHSVDENVNTVNKPRKIVFIYINRKTEPPTKIHTNQQQRAVHPCGPWDSILSEQMLAESVCTTNIKAKSLVSVDKTHAVNTKKTVPANEIANPNIHFQPGHKSLLANSVGTKSFDDNDGRKQLSSISDIPAIKTQNTCVPRYDQTKESQACVDNLSSFSVPDAAFQNAPSCSMNILPSQTLSKFSERRQVSIDKFTRQLNRYMPRFLTNSHKHDHSLPVNKISTKITYHMRLNRTRSNRFRRKITSSVNGGITEDLNSNNNAHDDLVSDARIQFNVNKHVSDGSTFLHEQEDKRIPRCGRQKQQKKDHSAQNDLNYVSAIKNGLFANDQIRMSKMDHSLLSCRRLDPSRSLWLTILRQLSAVKQRPDSNLLLPVKHELVMQTKSADDKESFLPRIPSASRFVYRPSVVMMSRDRTQKRHLLMNERVNNLATKHFLNKPSEEPLSIRRAKEQLQTSFAGHDSCMLKSSECSKPSLRNSDIQPGNSNDSVFSGAKLQRRKTKVKHLMSSILSNKTMNSSVNKDLLPEDINDRRRTDNGSLDGGCDRLGKTSTASPLSLTKSSLKKPQSTPKLKPSLSQRSTPLNQKIVKIANRLSTRPQSASSKLLSKIQHWEHEFRRPFNLRQALEEPIHLKTLSAGKLAKKGSGSKMHHADTCLTQMRFSQQQNDGYTPATNFKGATNPRRY